MNGEAAEALRELRRVRMLREGKCCRECYAHCNAPHFADDVCLRWYDGISVHRPQVDWRKALGREEVK
jgi:hypothetical protein